MKTAKSKTLARRPRATPAKVVQARKSGPFFKKEGGNSFFEPGRTGFFAEEPGKSVTDALPQNEEGGEHHAAPPGIESKLHASKGSGSPLSEGTRNEMERSIGANFSDVKIHRSGEDAAMNKQLNAQAFTHGKDIYFNEGKYDPQSKEGKHLLAHELTHVVQQGDGKTDKGPGPATQPAVSTVSPKIQRGAVDDVAKYLLTGNALLDFLVGVVAGIVEWFGDFIMGIATLIKEAFEGNIAAIVTIIGVIIVIVLACVFPEVVIPVLVVLGIIMGVISLVYYIYMMTRPGLTPYERGKYLGKAIVEGALLALTVVEALRTLKVLEEVAELSKGVGLLQKLRWVRQLMKLGDTTKVLQILGDIGDIEKTIEFIKLAKDAEKAAKLMELAGGAKKVDEIMELLKLPGVASDDLIRLLGRSGVDLDFLKRLMKNADGTPRLSVAELEGFLNDAKIADPAQLERLLNSIKLTGAAQLEALLKDAKVANGAQLERLLGDAKIADGAQLQRLLGSAKVTDEAQLERLIGNARIADGAALEGFLGDVKIADAAQLERLAGNAKLADGAQLSRLLNSARLADGAQLERLLTNARIADGAQLERLLGHAKITDGAQLERLLAVGSLADGAQLERLLNFATVVDAAHIERLLALVGNDAPRLENMINLIGDAVDLERFLRAGNPIWEGAAGGAPAAAQRVVAFARANGGAAQPGFPGNRVYGNNGRNVLDMILPRRTAAGNPITYTEYDVNRRPPRPIPRDANRVVMGSDGRNYFTGTHYTTFSLF